MGKIEESGPNTGMDHLDGDLQSLFEFCEGEKLAEFRKALEGNDVSTDDLGDMVPEGVVRVLLGLGSLQYEVILDEVGAGGRPVLEKAKRLIDENLAFLLEHPKGTAVLKRGVERLGGSAEDAKEPAWITALNAVTGVSAVATYVGKPPELTPCLRVVLTSTDDRLLLDTLMDWEDITDVTGGLTEVFARAMDEAKVLAEKGQLEELSETVKSRIAERVRDMQANLRTIIQLAPAYGIEIEEPSEAGSEGSAQPSAPEEDKATQGG